MRPSTLSFILLIFSLFTFAISKSAYCILKEDQNSGISGYVTFEQPDEKHNTSIYAKVKGFKPGTTHGFHIHESNNFTKGCISTGPHYNPLNKEHGSPFEDNRHIGDMGNLRAHTSDQAEISYSDNVISLFGNYSIIHRACLVHEKEDDLGQGGHTDSKTTGNAGARIACGEVIEGALPGKYDDSGIGFVWKFAGVLVVGAIFYFICRRSQTRYKPLEE